MSGWRLVGRPSNTGHSHLDEVVSLVVRATVHGTNAVNSHLALLLEFEDRFDDVGRDSAVTTKPYMASPRNQRQRGVRLSFGQSLKFLSVRVGNRRIHDRGCQPFW